MADKIYFHASPAANSIMQPMVANTMAVPSSPCTCTTATAARMCSSSFASVLGSLMRSRTLSRCMAKVKIKLIFASSVGCKLNGPIRIQLKLSVLLGAYPRVTGPSFKWVRVTSTIPHERITCTGQIFTRAR